MGTIFCIFCGKYLYPGDAVPVSGGSAHEACAEKAKQK